MAMELILTDAEVEVLLDLVQKEVDKIKKELREGDYSMGLHYRGNLSYRQRTLENIESDIRSSL